MVLRCSAEVDLKTVEHYDYSQCIWQVNNRYCVMGI